MWSENAGILSNVNLPFFFSLLFFFFFCSVNLQCKNMLPCGVMLHLKFWKQKAQCWWIKSGYFAPTRLQSAGIFFERGWVSNLRIMKVRKTVTPPPEKSTPFTSIDLSDFYGNYNSAPAQCVACCKCNSTSNKIKNAPQGKFWSHFGVLNLIINNKFVLPYFTVRNPIIPLFFM